MRPDIFSFNRLCIMFAAKPTAVYSATEQKHLNHLSESLVRGDVTLSPGDTIDTLRRVIKYHDWRYYVLSEPIATDYEYDTLFKKLNALEGTHPGMITTDSPTQRVAKGLTEDFAQVRHLVSMLSLDNSYNPEDVIDFDRKVKDLTAQPTVEYCVEPKFDGSSIALVYENDQLIRAATRGDGTIGEDITNNARALPSIPLSAPFSKYGIYRIELRGEVIIRKDVFEKINEQRKDQGLKTFQNSRNTASGSLRLKDPKEVVTRGLEAILYHVSYAVDKDDKNIIGTKLHTHYANIDMLNQCGFKTPVKELKICKDAAQVSAFLNEWEAKRLIFNIETDGMVIKVNDLKMQERCGSTSHHPRWAIAYKFAAKQAQTKLVEVDYQVGRTGAVTPVAKIAPVRLAGVTISSVSLHNEDFITDKDIMLGDTVIVERAGEVIPYIVGVVSGLRDGSEKKIHFPAKCPSCHTALARLEEESAWRCDNAECPAQAEERIIHYVSKDAMDIDGLGRSIVIDFIQRGYLKNIEYIYDLPYDQVRTLEGWGEKSVINLRAGIESSKGRPIWRLITALGIRHVGVTTAKDLAKHAENIFDFEHMSIEHLTNIEGIGPKVAQSIFDFFQNKGNIHLLQTLKKYGVNTENRTEDTIAKNNKLQGKTFLFTGSLQQFTRDRAKQMVEENGGTLLSGVSTKLNYLVVGEDAGSKLTKAKAIETITVLTEDEFLQLIG
jgi:DNA ligase (NAD+)